MYYVCIMIITIKFIISIYVKEFIIVKKKE